MIQLGAWMANACKMEELKMGMYGRVFLRLHVYSFERIEPVRSILFLSGLLLSCRRLNCTVNQLDTYSEILTIS